MWAGGLGGGGGGGGGGGPLQDRFILFYKFIASNEIC
jgi:hypothetical protein